MCAKKHGLRGSKVTIRLKENEIEIDCVDKTRTLMVSPKCDGNPWRASTCVNGRRYG